MNLRLSILIALTLINTEYAETDKNTQHVREVTRFNGTYGIWSPDGGKLAVINRTQKPHQTTLYETRTWRKLGSLMDVAMAFSNDGTKMLSALIGPNIKGYRVNAYDLSTFKQIINFQCNDARFVSNSNNMVVAYDSEVIVYDLTDGHIVKKFEASHATISPDGKKVAYFVDDTHPTIRNVLDDKMVSIDYRNMGHGSFSKDSDIIAFNELCGNITDPNHQYKTMLYSTNDGVKLGEFCGEYRGIAGHMLATAVQEHENCKTVLHDIITGQHLGTIPAYLLSFSPDGSKACVCSLTTPEEVICTITPTITSLCTLQSAEFAPSFSPDGTKIAINTDQEVKVWEFC